MKTLKIIATLALAFSPALAFAHPIATPVVHDHTAPVHDRTQPVRTHSIPVQWHR